MSSETSYLAQPDVADFFRRAIASEHLAHAYLLLGPVGVGKADFARDLTKYLFCLDRPSKLALEDRLSSCGNCRNCRRVDHGNFPDLHWFEREEGKRDISIDLMREFQRELSLKPVEGSWKVFVIQEADRLNVASANSLLKVLEEPPKHSLILLLAAEPDEVIPTILSRVHVVRFRPLPVDKLAEVLVRECHCSAEEATFLARLSNGSPGQARALQQEGFYGQHRQFIERIRTMKPAENFDVAEEMRSALAEKGSTAQRERELVCKHLDGLMLALRDDLERHCSEASGEAVERLQRALKAIFDATEGINANGNVRLILENMLFEVAQTMSPML